MIFGALQVTKVLSTAEVERAIEGSGKDFGKSIAKSTIYGTYSIVLLKNGIFYSISRDHKQPIKRSEFNKVLRHGYRCHGNHDVQYGRSVWALTVLNSEKTT